MSSDVGVARVKPTASPRHSQYHQRCLGQYSRRDRRRALVWVVAFNPAVRAHALASRPFVCDEVVARVVEATSSIREEEVRGMVGVPIVCWTQSSRGGRELAVRRLLV
eukprot:7380808-Prymnesium_polylepis.2